MVQWRRSTVTSGEVDLAVFEADPGVPDPTVPDPAVPATAGDDRPTVVLVHGWPDSHHVWSDVATHLAANARVFAYDTRGIGESGAPAPVSAYRIENLADDLYAVAGAISAGRAVHVVAHDWGSIQSWEAMSRPDATDRFASFTSVSGPSLDHVGALLRRNVTHPTPRSLRNTFSQVIASTYIAVFHLPVVPRLMLGVLSSPRVWREFLYRMDRTPRDRVILGPSFRRDALSGVRYYRANMVRKLLSPNPRPTRVPILELLNTRDFAIRPATFAGTHRYATKLWRRDSPTGHWLPSTHPQYLAERVTDFIEFLETGNPPNPDTFTRTRRFGPPQALTGKLAVVTGAGSGIGRATANALAEQGCDLALADIDPIAAGETAQICKDSGSLATAHALDVSDTAAFAAFAERVRTTQGIPDIVVNNAEVRVSGSALGATDEEVDRLIEVNLRGVITGSREFGRQLVARGIGGHIVNIASAATFTPQRSHGLYSASKAGVLAFTESLRAELADDRIGVTAICPGADLESAGLTPAGLTPAKVVPADTPSTQHRDTAEQIVAEQIVTAILRNKAVLPVTPAAKINYRMYRFTPWLSRIFAKRKHDPR